MRFTTQPVPLALRLSSVTQSNGLSLPLSALRENDSAPFSAVSTKVFTEFQRVIFLAFLWPVLAC